MAVVGHEDTSTTTESLLYMSAPTIFLDHAVVSNTDTVVSNTDTH